MTEEDKTVSKIPGFDKVDGSSQSVEVLRDMLTRRFVENKLPGILNAINGVAGQEAENKN